MTAIPKSRKPAGGAGSLPMRYSTDLSHLTKAVEWTVVADGLKTRVFADQASALRLATELRRQGRDAGVQPITPPVQLELQF